MVVYHGTTGQFYPPFKRELTFFSKTIDFAYKHAEFTFDEEDGRIVILECKLLTDLTFLFDPRNVLHLQQLLKNLPDEININSSHYKVLDKNNLIQLVSNFRGDVWVVLENKLVIKAIKQCGFVGHIAKEDEEITYCIYNPHKKVKILNYIGLLNVKEYEEIYDN